MTEKTLLLGAGTQHFKYLRSPLGDKEWVGLVTLDHVPGPKIDVVHDLDVHPLPFEDEEFQEIHAYEVLEHLGTQGDWRFFFSEWSEYYRIMKPGGFFCGSVPCHGNPWVWGDPSHRRALPVETFWFLDQAGYEREVGNGPMSDFRHVWKGDFELLKSEVKTGRLFFVLQCIKPSRLKA